MPLPFPALRLQHVNFVYLEPKTVYMIGRLPHRFQSKQHAQTKHLYDELASRQMQFLTCPYKDTGRNVYVSFLHQEHARALTTYIKHSFVFPQLYADAAYFSDVTRTPMVIIEKGGCDLDEKHEAFWIHYHSPQKIRKFKSNPPSYHSAR